ncbi:MAG: ATP synthase subunit I [Acidimicrobiales bacterium]|jgi:hypothetical protein|nr:ATP synthase subunit I [Acidimicrobiales bacterium]MDP6299255.1 ATP synthase subunit I [Acidimicrobiales bacterium]HJM97523.1 ATP synthase subunit I [Acidimicrobiales bacterium]
MSSERSAFEGAPEREVASDLFRRGVMISPILLLLCLIFWGVNGLACGAIALGIVLANFLAGAWVIEWAVRISPQLLLGAVLGGFVIRMGVITGVVLPIRNSTWFNIAPFAAVLIFLHLGLLIWEMRYVSATLSYPGLKPRIKRQKKKKSIG